MADWTPAAYKGPTPSQLTGGAPGGIPADMSYWLGQKYAIQGKAAEGDYQKNIADASTIGGLRDAQAFGLRAGGQADLERAATESTMRELYTDPDKIEILRRLLMPRVPAVTGGGAVPPAVPTAQEFYEGRRGVVAPPATVAPPAAPPAAAPPAAAPPAAPRQPPPPINWTQPPPRRSQLQQPTSQLSSFELPSLLRPPTQHARLGLVDPGSILYGREGIADVKPLRKGTASVKGKGKGDKADKGGGPPKGLEALLPALMSAMQAAGQGGPSAGPPAPGLRKGTASVKGKGSKADKGDDLPNQPTGLEAILPALMAAAKNRGQAPLDVLSPQGFARGISSVMASQIRQFADGIEDVGNGGFANYQQGTAAVPGHGTGKVDSVPAMLAPHEAVLNRAAADMVGRGLITMLNEAGAQQMGMRRGAA
jgi:hypothetical protein